MVALLVGMSVMAVLLGAALPVWNKQAQREREEEYLFRAHEYARGVMKFQRRAGPGTLPPTLDVLVQQRFVRRKYKDPLTGEDFQPVYQTVNQPGQPGSGSFGAATPGAATPGAAGQGTGATSPFGSTPTSGVGGTPTAGQGTPMPGAGVMGVVSKSKKKSIKIWNGRTQYDQWQVTYQNITPGKGLPPDIVQALGAGAAGGGGFGQPVGAQAPGVNPFSGGVPGGMPGAGGQNPFGQPGANPFGGRGPAGGPGGTPFGAPSTGPQPPSPFAPAYPPPPGGIFGGAVPKKD